MTGAAVPEDSARDRALEPVPTEIADPDVAGAGVNSAPLSFSTRTFGALRYRVYRWTLGGTFISQCGTWLHSTALGIVVAQQTRNPFAVGLVGFANFVPALVLGLVGGAVAERVDRRKLIIVMQWFEVALTALLALLFAFGLASLWVILLITFGIGISVAFSGPAWFAFFPKLVPAPELPSAISLNAMQFNLARIAGPALGGWMVGAIGPAAAIGLNSLSYVALLLPLMLLHYPATQPAPTTERRSGFSQIAEGFAYVRRTSWLAAMLLTVVVQAMFAAQIITLLPAFGKIDLNLSASGTGNLFVAFGIGGLIGALAASNVVGRVPVRVLVPSLIGSIGVAIVIVSRQTTPFGVYLSLALVGIVYIGSMSSMNALVQLGVDDSVRARVSSMWFTIFVGIFPIASLVWGAVGRRTSVATTFLIGGAVCVVYAACLFCVPRVFRGADKAVSV